MSAWLRRHLGDVIAYNRQPRKLAGIPVRVAVLVLVTWLFWTGSNNSDLWLLVAGLVVGWMLIDLVWYVAVRVRRPDAPIRF